MERLEMTWKVVFAVVYGAEDIEGRVSTMVLGALLRI